MTSRLDHESGAQGPARPGGAAEPRIARSIFLRQAARQSGFLAASLVGGFAVGVVYRILFDPAGEATFANFLRSGIHFAGLALVVWIVQTGFASGARSRVGAALRRLPLAGEVVVRALVLTAALIVVGLSTQIALYAEPYRLDWLTRTWLTVNLPRIVLVGFGMSLVIGIVVETRRRRPPRCRSKRL
jgi:hypothetical protein